jgi:hypothetical protein
MENITNRLEQVKERIWGMEDNAEELLHSDSNPEKSNYYYHKFQEL